MQILIIGAGDVGFQLAKRLSRDYDVTIIEPDPAKVKRASEQLDAIVIEGHGASYQYLELAGVGEKDILAAMTNNDEVNLLACKLAKSAAVPITIARVRNPELTSPDYPLTLEELGVDHIIHPEQETAEAVVRLIRQSSATDVIELEDGKIQIVGVRLEPGSELLHTPLEDLVKQFGDPPMRIAAINRNQTTLIPGGHDVLMPGDQVFGVCAPEYVSEFIAQTGNKDVKIEDVMILGGGLVGQFIAIMLKGINVKVVESGEDKSREIATVLPEALIIHGDGTDIDLLAVEGLMDMDAFIAVTGDDETNIIATLLARHLKVPRTIALVNKTEYLPITPTIGMGAVVSKQLLTVNAVFQYIQRQKLAAVASIPGVDVHIIEFIAEDGARITKKQLRDVDFPDNAIIGAVVREDELVIPRGDTQVQAADRVVVFSLPGALNNVTKQFK